MLTGTLAHIGHILGSTPLASLGLSTSKETAIFYYFKNLQYPKNTNHLFLYIIVCFLLEEFLFSTWYESKMKVSTVKHYQQWIMTVNFGQKWPICKTMEKCGACTSVTVKTLVGFMDLDFNSISNQKWPLSNPGKVYRLGLEQCLWPKTATVELW